MPCVINASQTSGLVMTSDLSGVLQLQNNGVNLPPLTVAPAFSAYGTGFQSLTSGVFTKIQYNTKEFDTSSAYDATTNYRFTPLVAGYYQINAIIASAPSATGVVNIVLYKNGSSFKAGNYFANNLNFGPSALLSTLVYMNGTTDYIEIYGFQSSGGNLNVGAANSQFSFSASLARSA